MSEQRSIYKPDGYTEADQRADLAFLVGVNYGRSSERGRIAADIEAERDKEPGKVPAWLGAMDTAVAIARSAD